MMNTRNIRNLGLVALASAQLLLPHALWAESPDAGGSNDSKPKFDCHELKGPNDEKVTPKTTFRADPKQVASCIARGWDPPGTPGLDATNWKRDAGKSIAKAGGAGGISYPARAPESPPGQRRARASVSNAVLKMSCSYPPRVKLDSSGVTFPKGTCWDFFNNILKDKNGGTSDKPAPDPVPPGSCPAESDTTGAYGVKSPLAGGGKSTLSCGGIVPLSSVEMVLNANPAGLAATENGAYNIWLYRKVGDNYVTVAEAAPLPRYLCSMISVGDGGAPQKSIDLTPPVAQMVTYDATATSISIRLQSRASMDPNFVPPYNAEDPEKYLVIPIVNGVPQIPEACADEANHFQVLGSKQDIVLRTSGESCEKVGMNPTPINSPTLVCPDGSKPNSESKCFDATGKPVSPEIKNNWSFTCPNDSKTGQEIKPVNGVCPTEAGTKLGTACPTGAQKIGNETVPCKPMTQDQMCALTEAKVSGACDTIQIGLDGACQGKTQFGITNRPNLQYPPGALAVLHPIQGRSALMADTVAGTKIYTQGQAEILLQQTAPPLVLNEGGQFTMKNGNILIMEAPATINMQGSNVKLTGGGELTSIGGTQLQSFTPGSTFTFTTTQVDMPLALNISSSITMPANYSLPTMPKVGNEVPYLRQPYTPPK